MLDRMEGGCGGRWGALFLSRLRPSDCPPLSYDPIDGEKTPKEEKKREKKSNRADRKRKGQVPSPVSFRPSADCTNGMTVEKAGRGIKQEKCELNLKKEKKTRVGLDETSNA